MGKIRIGGTGMESGTVRYGMGWNRVRYVIAGGASRMGGVERRPAAAMQGGVMCLAQRPFHAQGRKRRNPLPCVLFSSRPLLFSL